MGVNFVEYLTKSAAEIEQELDFYFKVWRKNARKINPTLLSLVDASITAAEGGKRIRGMLVKLGYELSGAGYSKEIIKVAAAYEIFQTAILAHDDVIDKSPLRRGQPTIFNALGGDHYALSQAICLGDIGFFQAFEMISNTNFPDELKTAALSSFSRTMTETALGQMLDIEIPAKKLPRKEEDALVIFQLKTARYTISGPLLLGAILGGADQKIRENIKKFGDYLGIAYQIHDDILGVFGTEKEIGKSVTSDIEEGKQTLLITKALEKASLGEKRKL